MENTNQIIFSVITPNYNSGEKLIRAINSLNSNSINFEHIIIDDCSTDQSFILAQQLESSMSSFNTVFLSNLLNSGPAVSRNKGLDIAKGKYILFLDADDYFIENALDILYDTIKSNNMPDILTFDYQMIKSTNETIDLTKDSNIANVICNPIKEYLLDKIISAPWGKCIKSSLAKRYRFPDLEVSEDAIYNLDIFINAKSVFILPRTLYVFDKTESDTLTRKPFNITEFEKLKNGWNYFERKSLREIELDDINQLISGRKIRFCALYYISRLVVTPDAVTDKLIVNYIKSIITENILSSKKNINYKIKVFCILFYLFPNTTIDVLKKYKSNGF